MKYTDSLDRTLANEGDLKLDQQRVEEFKIRKTQGEAALKALNVVQFLRQKNHSLRDLEAQQEACHAALSKLNEVADIRARRDLQSNDLAQKNEAIQALWVAAYLWHSHLSLTPMDHRLDKNSDNYVRFVKSQPVRESMEDQVTAVVKYVDPV